MSVTEPVMEYLVTTGRGRQGGGMDQIGRFFAGYASRVTASGEADTLLVTAVTGDRPGARLLKTTQHGLEGLEPVTAALLLDLGTHFLALASDPEALGLTEGQRKAITNALHELRRVWLRS